MCKILISPEEKREQFNFIVYNIAFSEKSGKFTTDKIYNSLKCHHINVEKSKLERLFDSWTDMGLLFDNEEEYIINSALS